MYDADGRPHPLPESVLPVELPDVADYSPVLFDPDDADSEPSPPLAKATDWVHVELDLGDGLKTYTRDTNVMPQWAGSSWYELRYTDPHNSEEFCAKENEAVLDGSAAGRARRRTTPAASTCTSAASSTRCCTCCTRGSGTRCSTTSATSAPASRTAGWSTRATSRPSPTPTRGASYVPAAEVVERDGKFYYSSPDGEIEVFQEFGKIGKSLKNSVSPDEICDDYGADTLRVYEMSMGPLEASRPWATKDVVGAHRFLQRVWRAGGRRADRRASGWPTEALDTDTLRLLHRTIAGVSEDYAALRNNTAAAKLIEYTNHLTKEGVERRAAAVEPLVLMVGAAGAAPGRGAVAAAGPRDLAGARAVPGGRPAVPGRGHRRVPGPGQRQGARPTSPWPPTPTPTPWRPRRWPTRRCRPSSTAPPRRR